MDYGPATHRDMSIRIMEETWIRRGRPDWKGLHIWKGMSGYFHYFNTHIPWWLNIFIHALTYTCMHLVYRCIYICICIYNTHRCWSVLCATLEPLTSLLSWWQWALWGQNTQTEKKQIKLPNDCKTEHLSPPWDQRLPRAGWGAFLPRAIRTRITLSTGHTKLPT